MSEQTRRGAATAEDEHTWTEQIEIAGSELVERTKELIAEGNVRRLIIRKPEDDKKLLEVPLTTGVAVGGALPDPARNRQSARKLAALEPALVCFGHGPPLRDTQRFVEFVAALPK